MKWILRLVLIVVVAVAGLAAYDFYRAGYLSLPDMPENTYTISFKNGLRGIIHVEQIEDESIARHPKYSRSLSSANPSRNYLGIPFDVPTWFEDAWSTCNAPTPDDTKAVLQLLTEETKRDLVGARLDAICMIEIEDKQPLLRGLLFSVPQF